MYLSVEQLIGDLLLQHNCVIVPSFGGFVAQRLSAKIDAEKGLVTPPRKSVMFNKQLINNDGLLIAAFAQANQITYEEANEEMKAHIREWEARLQMGGRITIDRVGNLFYDQERNLCFEQDRFYNLLMESFGLSAVRFVSVSDVLAQESKEALVHVVKAIELEQKQLNVSENVFVLNEEQAIVSSVPTENIQVPDQAKIIALQPKKSSVWRYVAAACLLPIAFYSFWLPVKTDVLESGVLSLSDFNPFQKKTPGVYVSFDTQYTYKKRTPRKQLEQLPAEVETFSYELDSDTYIPVSLKKKSMQTEVSVDEEITPAVEEVVVPTKTPEAPKPVIEKPQVATTSGSQIIVGSYLDRKNAADLIDQLKQKGIETHFIERDGKVRVSVGSASQLKTLEPTLKEMGISPWILK